MASKFKILLQITIIICTEVLCYVPWLIKSVAPKGHPIGYIQQFAHYTVYFWIHECY